MPLMLSLDAAEPLPPCYEVDTRIMCILYPKKNILNGSPPKTLSEDAQLQGQMPQTPANLFKDFRASFGSHYRHSCWMAHKALHITRRNLAALKPRSRVDFAQLSTAVRMPYRTWHGVDNNNNNNNNGNNNAADGGRPISDQTHDCGPRCFRYTNILSDERSIARVLEEYEAAGKLIMEASKLYHPELEEQAPPTQAAEAPPPANSSSEATAPAVEQTAATAVTAAASLASGDNDNNNDNINSRSTGHDMLKASANSGVKRTGAAAVGNEAAGARQAKRTAPVTPNITNDFDAAAAAAALQLDNVALAALSGSIVAKKLSLAKQVAAIFESSVLSLPRTLTPHACMPWELGILLTVIEQVPAAAATIYAVATASPAVDAGVWHRVRRALVVKTVLEFLEFWQGETGYLRAAKLSQSSNTRPLLQAAAAARQGLCNNASTRQGAVDLTGVPRPVWGGLWYGFKPAQLLHNVTPRNVPMRSSSLVSSLQLHWPCDKPVTHSEG
jgi:hypothetical protein